MKKQFSRLYAGEVTTLPEFEKHNMVSFVHDPETGLMGFIGLHRVGRKTPAFGATRILPYRNMTDALRDSLRLSRTMSYKAALAGLKYGGAKAALILTPQALANKNQVLKAYAKKVNLLSGSFITGADMGISWDDVKYMRRFSPYFVGVNTDPVKFTALGLFHSVKVVAKELFGTEDLRGRTFAIQGVGKIGYGLLELISNESEKIYVADIDDDQVKKALNKFKNVEAVGVDEIHKLKVDIFSPCATSNAITKKTIHQLHCKAVCGGANAQLQSALLGDKLHQMGILYAPDYVVNGGGLISVVDEYEFGNYRARRTEERVTTVKDTLRKVINKSNKEKMPTHRVADKIAEEFFENLN